MRHSKTYKSCARGGGLISIGVGPVLKGCRRMWKKEKKNRTEIQERREGKERGKRGRRSEGEREREE